MSGLAIGITVIVALGCFTLFQDENSPTRSLINDSGRSSESRVLYVGPSRTGDPTEQVENVESTPKIQPGAGEQVRRSDSTVEKESGPHTGIGRYAMSNDEKAAAIDALVSKEGISEVALRLDFVLASETVDDEWATTSEAELRDWYASMDSVDMRSFHFECAATVCYADFPMSPIEYHEKLSERSRQWIDASSDGFLATSIFVNADGLIRQYYFRDSFDIAKISGDR